MSRSMKKPKTFDCVAFKRQAQARWHEATGHLSAEERRAMSKRTIESGPLADFWHKLVREAKTAPKRGRL
jgi:hypothetical protein